MKAMRRLPILSLLLVMVLLSFAYAEDRSGFGLPSPSPAQRKETELGRRLFFDIRLSADGTISCANCHKPDHAFADSVALSQGVGHRLTTRNAPSLFNASLLESQFWDGRRDSLESQALDPLLNPAEHGLTEHSLVQKVSGDPSYLQAFQELHIEKDKISVQSITHAIASFERTLISDNTPFDRYQYHHEDAALSDLQKRGLALFTGRAKCSSCHTIGPQLALFTDNKFHNVRLGSFGARLGEVALRSAKLDGHALDVAVINDKKISALGRFNVTRDPIDIGKFKTPSLRNVTLTAPYMHDGSVPTLEEAIEEEIYYRNAEDEVPLVLTRAEKDELKAFLFALTTSAIGREVAPEVGANGR